MKDALVTVVEHSHYLKKSRTAFIRAADRRHLIDIFEKSDKDNLTKAEQNELAKIAALLKGDK